VIDIGIFTNVMLLGAVVTGAAFMLFKKLGEFAQACMISQVCPLCEGYREVVVKTKGLIWYGWIPVGFGSHTHKEDCIACDDGSWNSFKGKMSNEKRR
jgi:hypothetical protein